MLLLGKNAGSTPNGRASRASPMHVPWKLAPNALSWIRLHVTTEERRHWVIIIGPMSWLKGVRTRLTPPLPLSQPLPFSAMPPLLFPAPLLLSLLLVNVLLLLACRLNKTSPSPNTKPSSPSLRFR